MTFVRDLAREMGGHQVATVGQIKLIPNVANVIAAQAVLTVDLRNTNEILLNEARDRLAGFLAHLAQAEGVSIEISDKVRFAPVSFDVGLTNLIEQQAASLGYTNRRLNSGAGHDAQMLSRICPSAMIFVPSVAGISHNPAEHTEAGDLAAGCQVLYQTLLALSN
jgi:N-carbamoyl-L-amino-acid hydrolase